MKTKHHEIALRKFTFDYIWFFEDSMVTTVLQHSLCVRVYVITILFIICTLSQPATYKQLNGVIIWRKFSVPIASKCRMSMLWQSLYKRLNVIVLLMKETERNVVDFCISWKNSLFSTPRIFTRMIRAQLFRQNSE